MVAFGAFPVAAQQRPDAGTILDSNRQPGQPVPTPPAQVLPPAATGGAGTVTDTTPIAVKQIVIEGATLIPAGELKALVADLEGKTVTFAQLRDATDRITRRYQEAGYFVSRALIPQQDTRDGTVRIRVLEAKFGKVQVTPSGSVRLKPSIAENTLSNLGVTSGAPVLYSPLERGLLLLGELPGIQTNAALTAGANPGETDANIGITEGPLVNGLLGLDNLGNRYTGDIRATGAVNLNDPFGWGDSLGLRVNTSSGSNYAFLSYIAPVGSSGLRAGLTGSYLDYKLCCSFAPLGARGRAYSGGGLLSYPLIMRQTEVLTASLGAEHRQAIDNSFAGQNANRKINSVTANLSWLVSDPLGGLNSLSGSLVHGRLDLSANAGNAAFDAATAVTQGDYDKFRLTYTRVQTFATRHQILLRANGQWAGKNLDSSEKFLLGGYDGVRAYPQGEAPGDQAIFGTIEYSYALPVPVPGTLRVSTFVDGGRVQLNKRTWPGFQGANSNLQNNYGLAGAGVGLNWTLPQNFTLNFNVAAKLGSNPGRSATTGADADGRSSNVRGWLVLTKFL